MESKLQNLIQSAIKKGCPQSLRIIVRAKNQILINSSWGKSAQFYDVGSMTKILVTTPLCMKLFEEKRLRLHTRVEEYLPYLKNTSVGKITIKNLLCHHSGLEAWRPYYKKLENILPKDRQTALKSEFKREKIKNLKTCLYSDLDFIILGWVIEEVFDMAIDEAADLYIFKKLGMKNTFYNPKERFKNLRQFAPTRKNRERGVVRGVVFDDNTWMMGGIAGHAGLFSTAEDVTKIGSTFLDLQCGKDSPLIKSRTLKAFTKRAVPKKKGDWGLGFTLPSRPVSTAGTQVSLQAFGHVGYTGTSLWIDPVRKAVVTVLSNGTYPDRTNEGFKYLRREIHDSIWGIIDGRK